MAWGVNCGQLSHEPLVEPRSPPEMPPAGNRFQTVFIGNLSYDGTEDELRSLFAQMGPISTLRVVVDRETGKRKGFAFLEFFDPDTAQRAMHELNGVDFYGRALRVSIAEQDTKHGDSSSTAGAASRKRKGGPAGPPGSDRVASMIAGTANAQLFELLQQAKALAAHQPHDLLALLEHQPHLLRALHLGLDRLVPPSAEQQMQMQMQMQQQMQVQMQQQQQREQQQYQQQQQQQQQHQRQHHHRHQQEQHQQHQQQPFLPPIMQSAGPSLAPIVQTAPPPPQQQQQQQAPQEEAMLRQVMSLTPQQLEALPADQREQLVALKEELLRRQG